MPQQTIQGVLGIAVATGIVLVSLHGLSSSSVSAGSRPGSGDANCDGVTNSIDALLVLQAEAELISITSLPCLDAANVHIDSQIDARDAAPILQYEAGLLDDLPPIPQSILDTVFEATADLLDVAPDTIVVTDKETGSWPNSCLGLAGEDEFCLAVFTFGWRITVETGEHTVIWRIDSTGNKIRLEALI